MCFAQRLNAVTRVRLEPAAPRSRVKHSTVAYTIVSMLYHLTARMVLAFKPLIKAFKLLTGAIFFHSLTHFCFEIRGCTRALLCVVLIFSFNLPKQSKQSSQTHFCDEKACNSVTKTQWQGYANAYYNAISTSVAQW